MPPYEISSFYFNLCALLPVFSQAGSVTFVKKKKKERKKEKCCLQHNIQGSLFSGF